jgi:hypothetical protein
MDFLNSHLLSLILFARAAAARRGDDAAARREAAAGAMDGIQLSLVPLALSIVLWVRLRSGGSPATSSPSKRPGMRRSTVHLGVDGISVRWCC